MERTPDLVLAAFDYHSDNVLIHSLSDPVAVAKVLYGEGIITAEVMGRMSDNFYGRNNLLFAIRESIKINYNVLEIFANALCRIFANEHFGKALLKDYGEYTKKLFICLISLLGAIVKIEAKKGIA